MNSITVLAALLLAIIAVVCAQEQYYDDNYSNDNLYHDYAMRQEDKQVGGQEGGTPWLKMAAALSVGWFVGGKYHCGKLQKKMSSKFKKEQKDLYTQYYSDVYTLKEQNAHLVDALEQMGVKVR